MARSQTPKKNKSAHRVLEVLEYFNSHHGDATVMGVARAMNYPQSSTSELLQCLVALGYLHQDRRARTYRPSARVPLLGAWVQPKLFRQGSLLPMMDELADEAQATIVLGNKIGLAVQYIHVVAAPEPGLQPPDEGSTTSLLHSAIGKLLLSTHDRAPLRKLVHRLNAELEDPSLRISVDGFLAELDKIRARSFAVNYAETAEDGALIGVLLPRAGALASFDEQIAVGILAPRALMENHEQRYLQMLRGAVARHLGSFRIAANPVLPSLAAKEFAHHANH